MTRRFGLSLAGLLLGLGFSVFAQDNQPTPIDLPPIEVVEAPAAKEKPPVGPPELIQHPPKSTDGEPARVDIPEVLHEPKAQEGEHKKNGEKGHEQEAHEEHEEHEHEGHEASIHFEEIEHPGNGISPRIDYLLWRARRRALDFAIVDPFDNGIPEGPIESVFYDTDIGIRAGFTFSLPNPEWEFAAYYTYFHAHGNQTFTAPPGGVIYPTVLSPIGPREVTGAFAQANVDLDIVDVQFGPRLAIGECVAFQVYGGLRSGHINMKYNAYYTGGDAGGIDANFNFTGTRYFDEVRFRGLGLRLGGEGTYKVCEYATVFLRGSTSILSGRFSESHMEDNGTAILTQLVNVAEKWEQLVPVVELGIGVTYQFREDMRLALGYEFSHWFGMVDSADFVDDVAVGKLTRRTSDLTFEGLFLQLAVSF
jgi:hypothetical protein